MTIRPPRRVRPLLVAGLLTIVPTLHAAPIEALPEREWVSRTGTRIVARLAVLPDGPDRDARLRYTLVPAIPTRPPIVLTDEQVSLEDARYIDSVRSPQHFDSSWRDLQKAELTYADGQPIPGRLRYVNTFRRDLWFETRKEERFILPLSALSDESAARVRTAYLFPPLLETTLSDLRPLNPGAPTPPRFELKNVPLEKQDGAYCVPASAVMVAGYHGINITQKQLAHLSSTASRQHRGTWSADMANAMEALGFYTETRLWADFDTKEDFARFQREILPIIRQALHQEGPLYVSFKPGVYGPGGGHGCVIVGYNDANGGSFEIHNPWGRRERPSYREFSRDACEIVRFFLPPPAAGSSAALEAKVVAALHRAPVDLTDAQRLLRDAGLRTSLRFHARHDRRDDRNEVQRWALAQGPRIVRSTLERHLAGLLPVTRDGRIVGWHLIRLEQGNPNPVARSRGPQGWTEAARPPLDSLLNSWSTPVNVLGHSAWDMPLIEIGT